MSPLFVTSKIQIIFNMHTQIAKHSFLEFINIPREYALSFNGFIKFLLDNILKLECYLNFRRSCLSVLTYLIFIFDLLFRDIFDVLLASTHILLVGIHLRDDPITRSTAKLTRKQSISNHQKQST